MKNYDMLQKKKEFEYMKMFTQYIEELVMLQIICLPNNIEEKISYIIKKCLCNNIKKKDQLHYK